MKDIIFGGKKVNVIGNMTKEGNKAENFKAVKQDFSTFDFYKETEGKVKIISVFPSLDTRVCSLQTETFNEKVSAYSDDIIVVSISVDLPYAQKRFCVDKGIDNSIVVSDHKELEFAKKYGFLMEEHRLLTRGFVVVDKDNIVRYVDYLKDTSKEPDYDKAFEEAKKFI